MTEWRVDFKKPSVTNPRRMVAVFTYTLADTSAEAMDKVRRYHPGSEIVSVEPKEATR